MSMESDLASFRDAYEQLASSVFYPPGKRAFESALRRDVYALLGTSDRLLFARASTIVDQLLRAGRTGRMRSAALHASRVRALQQRMTSQPGQLLVRSFWSGAQAYLDYLHGHHALAKARLVAGMEADAELEQNHDATAMALHRLQLAHNHARVTAAQNPIRGIEAHQEILASALGRTELPLHVAGSRWLPSLPGTMVDGMACQIAAELSGFWLLNPDAPRRYPSKWRAGSSPKRTLPAIDEWIGMQNFRMDEVDEFLDSATRSLVEIAAVSPPLLHATAIDVVHAFQDRSGRPVEHARAIADCCLQGYSVPWPVRAAAQAVVRRLRPVAVDASSFPHFIQPAR